MDIVNFFVWNSAQIFSLRQKTAWKTVALSGKITIKSSWKQYLNNGICWVALTEVVLEIHLH